MTKTQLIAIVVGALMPLLISFVKQKSFPRWANMLIAIGACIAAGVVTAWANEQLYWGVDLWTTIGIVFVAAQATYAAYWRDSGVETLLNRINVFGGE